MMIKQAVGIRIRQLRTEKKISQEQLSLLSGLDRTYIASVEKGHRNITVQSLEKVIKALDTSFAEFFSNFTKETDHEI